MNNNPIWLWFPTSFWAEHRGSILVGKNADNLKGVERAEGSMMEELKVVQHKIIYSLAK